MLVHWWWRKAPLIKEKRGSVREERMTQWVIVCLNHPVISGTSQIALAPVQCVQLLFRQQVSQMLSLNVVTGFQPFIYHNIKFQYNVKLVGREIEGWIFSNSNTHKGYLN